MTIDYESLSKENWTRYGTDVADYALGLLANLYDERIHFIYELLQNAEDAISKRMGSGSNCVNFDLSQRGLKVTHYGKPFDEPDVRGICGINKSTKKDELTAIGRFGIGFKSVYAVTDRPEIRSAGQNFAIETYVHPVELLPEHGECAGQQTTFWFPFKAGDASVFDELGEGLSKLDVGTLLFLRHVTEIEWRIEGGREGSFCRAEKPIQRNLRHVTLLGTTQGSQELTEESWFVFSRPAESAGKAVGFVEIAYAAEPDTTPEEMRLRALPDSKLAAFFATGIQTGLGVRLQGPFRTTPARDNIPAKEPWNRYLIEQLAVLLVDSLETLKQRGALTVNVIRAMPIDAARFDDESLFRPLYEAVANTLRRSELLPGHGKTWLSSQSAAIADSQELRELVDSDQLTALFSPGKPLDWLSGEISSDRTLDLYQYLRNDLNVELIQPRAFVSKMDKEFLEAQSDDWILRLYEFLQGQSHVMRMATNLNKPWVRLQDGSHVSAREGGKANAFLPSASASGFPTVRLEVTQSKDALNFLRDTLELTEPDPVDDVIANILPNYKLLGEPSVEEGVYQEHLAAIKAAYETQLRGQRDKLVEALKARPWVRANDNSDNQKWLAPGDCYLPTERLRQLFEGVAGIDFVDFEVPGLSGEPMRSILLASGASQYLQPVAPELGLNENEKLRLRLTTTESRRTHDVKEDDRTLRGLNRILARIANLPPSDAQNRSILLWQELESVVNYQREAVVKATYYWFRSTTRSADYDATFIRQLKAARWVPAPGGRLATPREVVFEQIDPAWPPNAVLQAALMFRPSEVDLLARSLGLDPAIFNRLMQAGIRTEADLVARLGIASDAPVQEDEPPGGEPVGDNAKTESVVETAAEDDAAVSESVPAKISNGAAPHVSGQRAGGTGLNDANQARRGETDAEKKVGSAPGKRETSQRREFVSYLAVSPLGKDEEELAASDAGSHEERMRLEASAIAHITLLEPALRPTPPGNPGFDLFESDEHGCQTRWVEVKAMAGTLASHPVGLSKRQFETAQHVGERYWLYIVEHAATSAPRLLKIQNPAGLARTFTFDQGWREIAEVSQVDTETGEVIEAGAAL